MAYLHKPISGMTQQVNGEKYTQILGLNSFSVLQKEFYFIFLGCVHVLEYDVKIQLQGSCEDKSVGD